MLPALGDGGLHRPGATAGQTAKARTAAGPGRRLPAAGQGRRHRCLPGTTAACTGPGLRQARQQRPAQPPVRGDGASIGPGRRLPFCQCARHAVKCPPSSAHSKRRCRPVDATDIRRPQPPPPPPPSPLPAPADSGGAANTRRCWQQREPVPLQRRARSRRRQQREAAVAASAGGEIKTQWLTLLLSRTCKRGSNQAGAVTIRISPGPDRITSRINVRIKGIK